MRAIPISVLQELRLIGPPRPLQTARECLEMIGFDNRLLRSLHRIKFDSSEMFQQVTEDGSLTDYDAFLITMNDGFRLFFICKRDTAYLPALFIDGDQVQETKLFRHTQFVKQPNRENLIRLLKKITTH